MIVLIGGEKGGTGKTTIATNLAQMRTARGYDSLLIDTDKQLSASSWASTREEEGVTPRINCLEKRVADITKQRGGIAKDILDVAGRYDDVIIDAGGRDSLELRSAMVVADILIIPIQASQLDLWTLGTMEELVSNALVSNPNLKAYCVINRGSPNPQMVETGEASELITGELSTIEFSEVVMKDRVSYKRAIAEGKGIEEMKPTDPKALAEIESLYAFIFDPK